LKYKFILSDLDGVIRHFPNERNIAIEKKFGLPSGAIFQAAFDKGILTQAVCGKISDEDWRQMAAELLAQVCGQDTARDAISEWSNFPGQVDHAFLNYIESRFKDAPIAVLTNATTRLHSDLLKLNLGEKFFKIFNSAEIGICKPDPHIFQHVLQNLNCSPRDILFIDDSLAHVEAAIKEGMAGHHYKSLKEFQKIAII
jgi:HAD superfamily hydrolase (TIGR01509 family)